MSQPKISVIVPIYNTEHYLRECLDSLVNQTFESLEIILIDDGSTDNSGKIANQYSKHYPNVHVHHKINQGQSIARNYGLNFVKGEYVIFLDSDDYVPLDAYEKLYNLSIKYDHDIVLGDFMKATRKGKHKTKLYLEVFPENMGDMSNTHIKYYPKLVWDTGIGNRLYKKSFLDKHSLRFLEGVLYEDLLFSIKAHYLAESVGLLNEVVYYWRTRYLGEKSTTQSYIQLNNLKDRFQISEKMIEFQSKNNINSDILFEQYYKLLSNDFLLFISQLPLANKEYQLTCLKLIRKILDIIPDEVLNKLDFYVQAQYQLIKENNLNELLKLISEPETFKIMDEYKNIQIQNTNLRTIIQKISFDKTAINIKIKLKIPHIDLKNENILAKTSIINKNKKIPVMSTINQDVLELKIPITDLIKLNNPIKILLELKINNMNKILLLTPIRRKQQKTLYFDFKSSKDLAISFNFNNFGTFYINVTHHDIKILNVNFRYNYLLLDFEKLYNFPELTIESRYGVKYKYSLNKSPLKIPFNDILENSIEWKILGNVVFNKPEYNLHIFNHLIRIKENKILIQKINNFKNYLRLFVLGKKIIKKIFIKFKKII